MKFSELLKSAEQHAGESSIVIPEDWLQGRSAFGGLQAALALSAMRTLVPAQVPLRTFQMTFVAPVPAGRTRATAQILRQGKSAIQVEARIEEQGQVLALVVAVFGSARSSAIARMPLQAALSAGFSKPFRYLPDVVPAFTQHFAARWRSGGLPFSGTPEPQFVIDLDFLDSTMASEAHLLALADYVPPVALSMLVTPTAGSSMSWMLQVLSDRVDHLPLQGWRVDAEMVAASDGYTSQNTTIWGPDGTAIALSQQSMVVFG